MEAQSARKQDLLTMLVGFGLVIAVVVFFLVKGTIFKDKPTDRTNGTATEDQQESTFPVLDAKEALKKTLAPNPPRILDFRDANSYQAIHIPRSTRLDSDGISKLGLREEEVLVIAPDAGSDVKSILEVLDSAKARYAAVKDGIVGWQSAGGTVITFGNPSSPTDQSKVTMVTPDQFTSLLKDSEIGYRLLDVRSNGTPADGALHIPLNQIESRSDEIPPATNIALCGENGLEAFQAAVRLFDLGFYAVKALDGGCSVLAGK